MVATQDLRNCLYTHSGEEDHVSPSQARFTNAWSKEHCKAFLTEVIIVRQDVADASLAHRVHRDTIRQAIAFVGARFIKRHTGHERFMTLWRNFDISAAQNSLA